MERLLTECPIESGIDAAAASLPTRPDGIRDSSRRHGTEPRPYHQPYQQHHAKRALR